MEMQTTDLQKNPYVAPRAKVVEITNSSLICTSDYSTQSYDGEEYNPWS